jgi:ABC-2 type transport system ATP-binding protein
MASDVYLTVSLDFQYQDSPILKNIMFNVENGSTLGILGANGAGKTTLLKCLTGLNNVRNGVDWHPDVQLGSLIESPRFPVTMTIREHLEMIADLNPPMGSKSEHIDQILEQVGLKGKESHRIGELSLGQQQRLGLARVLWNDPNTLILDEPTNGLDPQGILDVRHLINRMRDGGRNVILASHLISEILQCCSHVLVLNQGHVGYFGPLEALKTDMALIVDSENRDELVQFLRDHNLDAQSQPSGIKLNTTMSPAELNQMCFAADIILNRIQPMESNLEQTLLQLMGQK